MGTPQLDASGQPVSSLPPSTSAHADSASALFSGNVGGVRMDRLNGLPMASEALATMPGGAEQGRTNGLIAAHEQNPAHGMLAMHAPEVIPRTRKLSEGQYWIPKPEQLFGKVMEYTCPVCDQVFVRQNNMRMHMWVHGPEYRQGVASLRVKDSSIQGHLPCYCPHPGCTKSFEHRMGTPLKDFKTLQTHYKRKHGDRPFSCSKCEKKFAVKGDWQSHEKVCGKSWLCLCGHEFKSKYWLQDHINQNGGASASHAHVKALVEPGSTSSELPVSEEERVTGSNDVAMGGQPVIYPGCADGAAVVNEGSAGDLLPPSAGVAVEEGGCVRKVAVKEEVVGR